MSNIFSIIVMFSIISCNGQNQKNTKGVVMNQNIKNNTYISDSFINKIRDTGIIKIGYDSKRTIKLFEYVFLKDLSFDNGKIRLDDTLNKMPYKLKKVKYSNNSKDEEYLIEEDHYYFTQKSYLKNGVLNEGTYNQIFVVIGIVTRDSINNSICNLKVGDTITKIPIYFKYAFEPIREELDTSFKKKYTNFSKERYVDVRLNFDKSNRSPYWLRFVCDINIRKIIRIEAGY